MWSTPSETVTRHITVARERAMIREGGKSRRNSSAWGISWEVDEQFSRESVSSLTSVSITVMSFIL